MMDLKIIRKTTYDGLITMTKHHIKLEFFTKKQMKLIYPNRNYRVVGEIGNKTGIQCGAVETPEGQPLPIYKERTHNTITESVVGYIAVDYRTYLAVIKNIILKRTLIAVLVLAIVCTAAELLVIALQYS